MRELETNADAVVDDEEERGASVEEKYKQAVTI